MKNASLCFVVSVLLLGSGSLASTTRGYVKAYGIQSPPKEDPLRTGLLSARVLHRAETFENFTCEMAYEIRGAKSRETALVEPNPYDYRWKDLNRQVVGADQGAQVLQNLDRFYCTKSFKTLEVTTGRSPVTFGSARYFSPLDVLIPYSYSEIDREYRIGVDTLRARWSPGEFSEVDIGWVMGREKQENGAVFARGVSSLGGADIEVLSMVFQKATLFGLGVQTSVWDFGVWSEFAQVVPPEGDPYWRGTLGLSYMFTSEITANMEFHHSSIKALHPFAFTKGGVFFTGADYAAAGGGWNFSPLWNLTLSFIHRFGSEASTFFSQGLEYNAAENLYFDLGSFWNLENQGEFKNISPTAFIAARTYF